MDHVWSIEDAQSLRTAVGGRLTREYCKWDRSIVPELRAQWMHEFMDDEDRLVNAAFSGTGISFVTQGVTQPEDIGIYGGGLTIHVSDSRALFGGYDIQAGGDQQIHMGSGGLRLSW